MKDTTEKALAMRLAEFWMPQKLPHFWGMSVLPLLLLVLVDIGDVQAQSIEWASTSSGSSGDTGALLGGGYLGEMPTRTAKGAATLDSLGSTVVTGSAAGDILTIKYGAGGEEVWKKRYVGPGNLDDSGLAVAVDENDDVIITGRSYHPTSAYDYVTIKYSGVNGEQLWISRYAGGGFDLPHAIAVDSDDHVLVTGTSQAQNGYDFITIKYDGASGSELWRSRHTGPGNESDTPYSLAIDPEDNVLVTGSVRGQSTATDIRTIKYSGTDGSQLWAASYNGPANSTDVGYDIAISATGFVYVVGASTGVGSRLDIITLKYSLLSGSLQWSKRETSSGSVNDEGVAISIDGAGDILVAGKLADDYYIAKYHRATGARIWEALHDGTANSSDSAYDIIAVGIDDIYVTGSAQRTNSRSDITTLKYNGMSGALVWMALQNGGDDFNGVGYVVLADVHGVRVAGSSRASNRVDYSIVNYSISNGAEIWASDEGTVSGLADIFGMGYTPTSQGAIEIDDLGRAIVVGGSNDVAVATAFSAAGQVVWRSEVPMAQFTNIVGVAESEAIIGGTIRDVGETSNYRFLVTKLNLATGIAIWSSVDTSASSGGFPAKLTVDVHGDAILTGEAGTNVRTVKFDGDTGAINWAVENSGQGIAEGRDVRTDVHGNVFVLAGNRSPTSGSNILVLKYAAESGALLWDGTYDGPSSVQDEGYASAVDETGNVIIGGVSATSSGSYSLVIVKFNGESGSVVWSINIPDENGAYVSGILTDEQENIFAIESGGNQGDVYKIDGSSGAIIWNTRLASSGGNSREANALALGFGGRVAVVGSEYGGETFSDFVVAFLDEDTGDILFQEVFDFGYGAYNEGAWAVAIAPDGSFRVAGRAVTTEGERIGVLRASVEANSALIFDNGFEVQSAIIY
jgi:hypothetical protein